MTNALRYARAAPALAMSYLSIVLTIIYGRYIFDEVLDSLHASSCIAFCMRTDDTVLAVLVQSNHRFLSACRQLNLLLYIKLFLISLVVCDGADTCWVSLLRSSPRRCR